MQATTTRTASAAALPAYPLPATRSPRGAGVGRGITGFVAFFLLVDGGGRLAGLAPYLEGTVQFGYDVSLAPWIGLTLLVSTVLYLVPRAAVLGAVLLTGYLGGAAAAQVRAGDPWFLFPVLLGVMVWGGLWLRDPRVRALLPLRG